jgi:DNA-binding beta-propeller fold protein YncE
MSNDIYATVPQLNAIVRTDLGRGRMNVVTSTLSGPAGLAFAPDHTLYVAERGAGRLSVVDDKGQTRTHASGLGRPGGMAVDAAGNVYVTDDASDSIKVIDTKGAVRTLVTGTAKATRLAFDGSQNLYVGAGSDLTLFRFDLQGQGGPFHTLTKWPTGIACDPAGNVYVSGEYLPDPKPVIAKLDRSGRREVLMTGERAGSLTVLGWTVDGYLVFSSHATTLTLWRSPQLNYVRSTVMADTTAVRPDFTFQP